MYNKSAWTRCYNVNKDKLRCSTGLSTLLSIKINKSSIHNNSCNFLFRRGTFWSLFNSIADCNKNIEVTGNRNKPIVNQFARMCNVSNSANYFSLNDYDCIGFDLDNTLCEYNISSCAKMEYEALATFLVKNRNYDPHNLMKPLDENSYDFLQKGLFLDFVRGNILKIDVNAQIIKCSHGTRFMTEKEIVDSYGEDRKWEVTSEFSKNMLYGITGPLSQQTRALLDYFDMPASLAFARIVDTLDNKLGGVAHTYNIWPDVLSSLHYLYDRQHFSQDKGGYFDTIKANPETYINRCNPALIDWLKNIKKSKLTFLITGSDCDFASFTAEAGLGKNWKSLFDIIICYARKPLFFSGCRPFLFLDGFKESYPILGRDLKLGQMYNQGNWQDLYQLFSLELHKKEPRCLYFGDNLIQDVYTPSEYTKCDTISVVKELVSDFDEKETHDRLVLTSDAVLTSQSWGSYLFSEENQSRTFWDGVIRNHSKMCIPSISALVQYPFTHQFKTFCKDSMDGYLPILPNSRKFDVH